ncbi:hypothetical protein CEUSTIGMA_g1550.t1 [Chlamydomonas eustigma]|uniref:BRO1 domain-containing protein n=1 Tax=Chlamydomonas eustigma TaxID=1157962 RepID=A0A250WTG2_9CHLO|nr:hypothetical protein CEUSTIGMA_g1550.t1 [Chlamydomonas eustigma]|eukprot:GAX74101.1 hypothetical protein CEUSTIGMA_g1550.t1 [Chlamydomonas eustigma]
MGSYLQYKYACCYASMHAHGTMAELFADRAGVAVRLAAEAVLFEKKARQTDQAFEEDLAQEVSRVSAKVNKENESVYYHRPPVDFPLEAVPKPKRVLESLVMKLPDRSHLTTPSALAGLISLSQQNRLVQGGTAAAEAPSGAPVDAQHQVAWTAGLPVGTEAVVIREQPAAESAAAVVLPMMPGAATEAATTNPAHLQPTAGQAEAGGKAPGVFNKIENGRAMSKKESSSYYHDV